MLFFPGAGNTYSFTFHRCQTLNTDICSILVSWSSLTWHSAWRWRPVSLCGPYSQSEFPHTDSHSHQSTNTLQTFSSWDADTAPQRTHCLPPCFCTDTEQTQVVRACAHASLTQSANSGLLLTTWPSESRLAGGTFRNMANKNTSKKEKIGSNICKQKVKQQLGKKNYIPIPASFIMIHH